METPGMGTRILAADAPNYSDNGGLENWRFENDVLAELCGFLYSVYHGGGRSPLFLGAFRR